MYQFPGILTEAPNWRVEKCEDSQLDLFRRNFVGKVPTGATLGGICGWMDVDIDIPIHYGSMGLVLVYLPIHEFR